MDKEAIYALLKEKCIQFEITNHKPVYTMAELEDVELPYPEADAKNLFVRDDKKQHYYLITVKGSKRVDLKAFRKSNGTRPLTFTSADEMQEIMRLAPGSVTPFGLLNDESCRVAFYLDSDLANGMIGCHPNDNTATVWLKSKDLISVIEEHGNAVNIVCL